MSAIALLLLAVALLLSVFSAADERGHEGNEVKAYTITEPYVFPVVPGDPGWYEFTTSEQKIDASQVPNDILRNMTTGALVETVLNCPTISHIYLLQYESGYRLACGLFNSLNELDGRPDAVRKLNEKIEELSSLAGDRENPKDEAALVKLLCAEIIVKGMTGQLPENSVNPPSRYTTTYIRTPNNTNVLVYEDLSWSDHNTTESSARAVFNSYLSQYPSAVEITTVNPKYNCHSYAFYGTSTNNAYWINNATAYITDGSYVYSAAASGRKVYYHASVIANEHSGIVQRITGGVVIVRSKWGYGGVVEHPVNDCPYNAFATSKTYWALA
ncbi:MAG: hypothetical protein LBI38_01695 [Oscillospiraceae bacterium]|nr:hypothetical protein [Oscillospiraceae bacterium]